MDATTILLFLLFATGLIWYSYQIWFNAEAFLTAGLNDRTAFRPKNS
jgi:hypothetical protein